MTAHSNERVLMKSRQKQKKFLRASMELPKVPPISAYPSRSAWETAVWDILVAHLVRENGKSNAAATFKVLITEPEQRVIVHRLAAIDRIISGKGYRSIAEELWLSSQTISVIRKSVEQSTYRSYRQRGKKKLS